MCDEQRARIRPVVSLQEFFKDSVAQAMARQRIKADEHTAYYVVNLLTLFARSEALFDRTENGLELKPLAKVIAESVATELALQRHALQRVGDVALFIAGFLPDGLVAKLVDVDYYVRLGGSAYSALSDRVRAVDVVRIWHVQQNAMNKLLHYRQTLHSATFKNLSDTCALGLEKRCLARDVNRLGDGTDFELDVNSWCFVDSENDIALHGSLEA